MTKTRTNDLRIAIIGCGRIAGHHCRSIAAVDGASIAAVCDLEFEKARAYGNEFGVPAFDNYHRMFETVSDIDVAAVITPSGMHFEHALDIIERYKVHTIIEKPTFMVPGQVREAYACARVHGKKVFPVFQNRYNKAVQRVKQAFEDGELGNVRTASVRLRWCRPQRYYDLAPWRGTFSHDGGALTNQTIHHIDLLRFLGGKVDSVMASMRTLGADIEVEDTATALISYGSGSVGALEATTAARPDDFEASISFVCDNGLAQIGGIAVNELQVFTPDPEACAACSEDFKSYGGNGAVYGFGHTQMYRDIVADLADGEAYPVSENDCFNTIELLHAFYLSDESGHWVNVGNAPVSGRLGRANDEISSLYRTPS